MFIVQDYTLAVFFCVITMLCWGSWANTQKLAASSWRFELFYWDYVIGIVIFSATASTDVRKQPANMEGRSYLTSCRRTAKIFFPRLSEA